jgi:O-antigen/teichoic acid export membrane protein
VSLKKQTLIGVFWTFIDTFFLKGLIICAGLVLARILGPKEFGLMGMISIFIAVGIVLIDSGLSSSLIRNKINNDEDYNTVFYANLFFSILIYFLIYFSASVIADFYNQDSLTKIIRVYCLTFVISALSAVHMAILIKELDFKKITLYNFPSTIIGICVGLYLAYSGYGVWSLIFMNLVVKITLLFILWANSNWKPSFSFSIERFKFHFNYGYKLLLSSLLNKVFTNVYHVIIGKSYDINTLGYYERSVSLNAYSNDVITGIIKKVTFPLLSKIQDDEKQITQVYKRILKLSFYITAPLMLVIAAEAKPLFNLILGEEWLSAVPYFQVLCIASILYPNHSFNLNVLKVYGRSDLFLKLEIYKKLLISFLILITYKFGVMGLVWSSVFSSFIAMYINTYYSSKYIDYKYLEQMKDMIKPLILSILVSIIALLIISYLDSYNLYFQIIASTFTAIVLYLIGSYLMKIESLKYSIKLINNRL